MVTQSEIKLKAKKINSISNDICQAKDRCQNVIFNSNSWWQSEAGKVLRSEYSEIQADITKLLRNMSNLENSIITLSSKVERANEERRKQMEIAKKAASTANKK